VSKGTKLCHVDLKALEVANKQSDVIVVFTNQDKVADMSLNMQSNVNANDLIGQVKTK
jgi:PTS system N-acetylglucosamine-specific IIC component